MSKGVKQSRPANRREPVDFLDAEQALRAGDEQRAAMTVECLAEALSLVATVLDPKNEIDAKHRLGFKARSPSLGRAAMEEDGKSRLDQAKKAIENASAGLLARYFRDAAEFLASLGAALNPASSSGELRLKFRRRRKGRPPHQSGRDKLIAYEVLVAMLGGRRGGASLEELLRSKNGSSWPMRRVNQETAIRRVAKKYGVSRSTIMRALEKVPPSLRKSKNS